MDTHFTLLLLVFLLSSFATHLIVPSLRKLGFQKGWVVKPRDARVDIPSATRKASHPYEIPLTGGLVFLATFVMSMGLLGLAFPALLSSWDGWGRFAGLFVASMLIGIMGLSDDIRRMGYRPRLLVAGLTSLALLLLTVYGQQFVLPGGFAVNVGIPELLLLLVWCLGLTNAINLIDGLDGSATGIIAIAAVCLRLMTPAEALPAAAVLTAIIACCVAFLAYNFHPAIIFLGSTGTLFLGFTLAILSIWPTSENMPNHLLPFAILVFAVPLYDMGAVMFVRLWHRKNPFKADSWHIHDRLLLTGVSRKQAAFILWMLSAACGSIAYLTFREMVPYLVAVGLTALMLSGFYLVVVRLQKPPAAKTPETIV